MSNKINYRSNAAIVSSSIRPWVGFTLIELLVVVAIISILMSILLPSLGKAMGRGKQIHCLSNMKQIAVLTSLYTTDYGWLYPRRWKDVDAVRFPDSYTLWNMTTDDAPLSDYHECKNYWGVGCVADDQQAGCEKRCDLACPLIGDNDQASGRAYPNLCSIGYNTGVYGHSAGEEEKALRRMRGPSFELPSVLCLFADTKVSSSALDGKDGIDLRHLGAVNVLYVDLHADSRLRASLLVSLVEMRTRFWDARYYDDDRFVD